MTQPTSRVFAGIAKDTLNSTLAASVAAGATSVTLTSAASIATTDSLIILDGPNSETVSITAITSNTLTVSALTYAHSANVYCIAQPSASLGPSAFVPVTSFEGADAVKFLEDKGFRGSAVDSYGEIAGTREGEVTIGGDIFADTFGWFLAAILGSEDFTSGTPNTHAFGVQNTAQAQPDHYALYQFTPINTRVFAGAKASDLSVKAEPGALLTYTSKFISRTSGVVANPTPSFSTLTPKPGWQGVVTIGGSPIVKLLSFDLDIKRDNALAIPTFQGIQDPLDVFVGSLGVSGKLNFVVDSDNEYLNYLNNTQPSLVIAFSQGSGASLTTVQFQMTKCSYQGAKIVTHGKSYIELETNFKGVANTTDATASGTGYSPIKASVQNTIASGVYL